MRLRPTMFGLLLLVPVVPAVACRNFPEPPFEEQLVSASSVFVFELETLAVDRNGDLAPTVSGRIRVLRTLKGPGPAFQFIRLPVGWCGGVPMLVGHPFVVATSQTGKLLTLERGSRAAMDLDMSYDTSLTDEQNDQSSVMHAIRMTLATGQPPKGFRFDELGHAPPLPPPPPPGPAGKKKTRR